MTLPVQTPQIAYAEDGATTEFPVPFRYGDPSYIRAERKASSGAITPLAYGTDYSVSAGNTDAGGTLTVTSPAASGNTLVIWRETPLKSDGDYETNAAFTADTHEKLLDEAAMRDQDQQLAIDRAPKVPRGETAPDIEPFATRKGLVALWHAATGALASVSLASLAAMLAEPLLAVLPTTFKGDPGSPGEGYSTRVALAEAGDAATPGDDAYLTETPRFGKFIYLSAAQYLAKYGRSLELAIISDPDQGLHVAPTADPTGASGAWVRAIDSVTEVTPFHWGAYGNNVDDDTLPLQQASDYLTAINAFDPFMTGKLLLKGATFRVSAKLLCENHSLDGGNGMLLSAGNHAIIEPRGNNLVWENLRLWYTTQTSNAAREAMQLCTLAGKQTSKSTFINIITRNAYRGWTATSSGGSCWGNVFINCRSDNSYDYAAYFNFPIGTTTVTFINWHSKGLLGAGNPKGMYVNNCQEVISINMAADQITGGLALEIVNAQSSVIDLLTLESCQITTPDGALVSVLGGVLELGRILSKVGLYQPGVGQTCQILKLGSTTRLAKIGDIERIQDQAGANGTFKKLKLNNTTIVKAQYIALADVNTQGNDKLFHNDDIQGYASSFAGLPAAGVALRRMVNSAPSVGEPSGWEDTGAAWYGLDEVALPITTDELTDIGNAVNTAGKFYGRKYYNTTTNQIVHAQGTTAAATWRSANGNVHTPA
jgi:hypothetical protein